jgi:sarcosine oxidase subunit beta
VRLVARTNVVGLAPGTAAKYAVRTDRGDVAADVVVNAAGAWAGQVGDALATPVQVVNERHEAYVFELPPDLAYTIPMVLDYVPGSSTGEGLYFRQEGEHQLIAGMHSNEVLGDEVTDPDEWFAGATHHHAEVLIERLARALPGIEEIGYRTGWAGLYPHSPDGELVAGPHPDNPDVLVGGGLGGNGLSVALSLGEALAEWARFGELRAAGWAQRLVPRPAVVARPPERHDHTDTEAWT